jgi:AraC-like DNA-binding protein
VRPHHRHQFDGSGESVAQLFVEPETTQGRALLERHPGASIGSLPGEIIEPLIAALRRAYDSRAADDALITIGQRGISFRAYLLWARVGSAVGAAMGGMSWTDAAQEWGFADSAHLSRTCRRMFGIAPSMLIRASERAPAK